MTSQYSMYFMPKEDITTQELAIITGFLLRALVTTIDAQHSKTAGDEGFYLRLADRATNLNKTVILDRDIYNSMPENLQRHFSMY